MQVAGDLADAVASRRFVPEDQARVAELVHGGAGQPLCTVRIMIAR
jgi:hypothetical protein